MSPWQSVPPADAAAHRLYGFRGWLIVYCVFALAWLVVGDEVSSAMNACS